MPVEHSPPPTPPNATANTTNASSGVAPNMARDELLIDVEGSDEPRPGPSGPVSGTSQAGSSSKGGASAPPSGSETESGTQKQGRGKNKSTTNKNEKTLSKTSRLFDTPVAKPDKPSAKDAATGLRRSQRSKVSFSDEVDEGENDRVTNTVKKAPRKTSGKASTGKSTRGKASKTGSAKSKTLARKSTRIAKKKNRSETLVATIESNGDGTGAEAQVVQGETEDELEKVELLTLGENSFVNIRARLRDFINHLENNCAPPLTVEESKQMKEIRKELGSLCFKQCYLRGRNMLNAGKEVGNQLIDAYGKLSELLIKIDERLTDLCHGESSPDMGGADRNGVRTPPQEPDRTPPELTTDSSDADWSPSMIPTRRTKRKSKKERENSRHHKRSSTPSGSRRRRLSFSSTRTSVDRSADLYKQLFDSQQKRAAVGSSPSSSPSSSSSSSSSGSSDEDSDSSSSCDSRLSSSSSSSSEPRDNRGSSGRKHRRHKTAKKAYRYSPKVRHVKSRKKKTKSRRHDHMETFLNGTRSKRRHTPHYLTEGGEGRRFYRKLPSPWNIPPSHRAANFTQVATLLKSNLIPSFDGSIGSYWTFRNQFVMSVHGVDIPIVAKFMFLRNALSKVNEMKSLLHSVPAGTVGYGLLIQRLEDKYGGEERMLAYHLEELKQVPQVVVGDLSAAEALYDAVHSYQAALVQTGSRDPTTHSYFSFVKGKLSHALRLRYLDYCSLRGLRRPGHIKTLLRWLYRGVLCPLRLEPAPPRKQFGREGNPRQAAHLPRGPEMVPEGQQKLHKMQQSGGKLFLSQPTQCVMCQGDHNLPNCSAFLALEVPDRRELVHTTKLCYRCLIPGHLNSQCVAPSCSKCGKNHHTLTHGPSREYLAQKNKPPKGVTSPNNRPIGTRRGTPKKVRVEEKQTFAAQGGGNLQEAYLSAQASLPSDRLPSEEGQTFMYQSLQASQNDPLVSLRFVPVKLTSLINNRSRYVAALIDGGSNMTTTSEAFANHMGAPSQGYPFSVLGINGHVVEHQTRLFPVTVSDLSGTFEKNIVIRTLPQPAGNLHMIDWNQYLQNWEHLRGIKLPERPLDLKVELIIGNDQPYFHRSLEEIVGKTPDEPVARRTALGWTIAGPTGFPVGSSKQAQSHLQAAEPPSGAEISPEDCMVMGFRDRPPILHGEDRRALGKLHHSLTRETNGQYSVDVLWSGESRPGNNKQAALEAWIQQLRRLEKVPARREAYEKVIQGWLDSGYMRRLPDSAYSDPEAFYLVHFPVYRQDKSTTKVRVVMNGKASFPGGSLNEFISKGPKLLNDLTHVLLRFRRFRIAIAGDIKEMFLQVLLKPEDRAYHRIFYTFRKEGRVCILEAWVHQFGNRGSPVTVVFVIKWVAFEFRDRYPLASCTVLDSSLVDDCMDSVRNETDGKSLVEGLKAIFSHCGMKIHKWVCSVPGILPPEELCEGFELRDPEQESEFPKGKALGIFYDSTLDEFRFRAPKLETNPIWSRRAALSFYMGVYDPKGMILPVLMEARLLFQETWHATSDWNSSLDKTLSKKWNKWSQQLEHLKTLRFPRWLGAEHIEQPQHGLHVFTDASKSSFGAVIYLVSSRGCVFVMAKGKLHKKEGHAITLAELEGGRLGVKLCRKVAGVLGIPVEFCHFWVDSTTVLAWIKAPSKVLPYFVARVSAYIRDSTLASHWRYVDTKQNPADLVSRGCSVQTLAQSSLWLQGPEFLHSGDWPAIKVPVASTIPLPDEAELARLVGIFVSQGADGVSSSQPPQATGLQDGGSPPPAKAPLLGRVSNFLKGLRVMTHLARFLKNLFSARGRQTNHFEDGLQVWIRLEQREHFGEVCTRVSEGLAPLEPVWRGYDLSWDHGVLYIGGRTGRSPVPVLPKESQLTLLWTTKIHELDLRHAGGPLTLKSETRGHFWVFKGSSLFNRVVRSCTTCTRTNPRPKDQRMGPLPAFRLDGERSLAFEHIAIDFAGPWHVEVLKTRKLGSVRIKKYMLMICCCVYRAVCCIGTEGRSTSDVALALQEFASRHRIPSHIHSDNAPEFVCLANEFISLGTQTRIQLPLSPDWSRVVWTFSHPRAPHSNGIAESLVGVTKRALAHALRGAPLTEPVFRTALAFATDIVNRRPIGNLSEHPSDPRPFTPGMFIGQQFAHMDHMLFQRLKSTKVTEQWKLATKLQDKFAERFFTELVPELVKRDKWWDTLPELVRDQVVIVLNCPPNWQGWWPLGRVKEVKYGKDGVVRGALVLVNGQEYLRHMKHLIPLA